MITTSRRQATKARSALTCPRASASPAPPKGDVIPNSGSTLRSLGYPGEGPRIATWNARGLSDMKKMSAVLRAAKREQWDALLVQELKWGDPKVDKSADTCARSGGWILHAARGPSAGSGGAAVFVRDTSDTIKVTGPAQCALYGLCAVPVEIEGKSARLVSIYAPANARLQHYFINP